MDNGGFGLFLISACALSMLPTGCGDDTSLFPGDNNASLTRDGGKQSRDGSIGVATGDGGGDGDGDGDGEVVHHEGTGCGDFYTDEVYTVETFAGDSQLGIAPMDETSTDCVGIKYVYSPTDERSTNSVRLRPDGKLIYQGTTSSFDERANPVEGEAAGCEDGDTYLMEFVKDELGPVITAPPHGYPASPGSNDKCSSHSSDECTWGGEMYGFRFHPITGEAFFNCKCSDWEGCEFENVIANEAGEVISNGQVLAVSTSGVILKTNDDDTQLLAFIGGPNDEHEIPRDAISTCQEYRSFLHRGLDDGAFMYIRGVEDCATLMRVGDDGEEISVRAVVPGHTRLHIDGRGNVYTTKDGSFFKVDLAGNAEMIREGIPEPSEPWWQTGTLDRRATNRAIWVFGR